MGKVFIVLMLCFIKGTPEFLDFVATVAGGVLGAVILHAAR